MKPFVESVNGDYAETLFEFIHVYLMQSANNDIESGFDKKFACRHLYPYRRFLKENIDRIDGDETFLEIVKNFTPCELGL